MECKTEKLQDPEDQEVTYEIVLSGFTGNNMHEMSTPWLPKQDLNNQKNALVFQSEWGESHGTPAYIKSYRQVKSIESGIISLPQA